jgi:hypothetical protein
VLGSCLQAPWSVCFNYLLAWLHAVGLPLVFYSSPLWVLGSCLQAPRSACFNYLLAWLHEVGLPPVLYLSPLRVLGSCLQAPLSVCFNYLGRHLLYLPAIFKLRCLFPLGETPLFTCPLYFVCIPHHYGCWGPVSRPLCQYVLIIWGGTCFTCPLYSS